MFYVGVFVVVKFGYGVLLCVGGFIVMVVGFYDWVVDDDEGYVVIVFRYVV